MHFSHMIWRADSQHLEMFAEVFEQFAHQMRIRADRQKLTEKRSAEIKQQTEERMQIGKQALAYFLYGMPAEEAITETAAETDVTAEEVEQLFRTQWRIWRYQDLKARSLQIAIMQRSGMTQAQIAQRLGLHQSSISRHLCKTKYLGKDNGSQDQNGIGGKRRTA